MPQKIPTPPNPRRQFDYIFRDRPEVLTELQRLGLRFEAVDVREGEPGETWPALILPSGTVLAIAQDDEGNGPGALHVFDL